jgi:hypothetical protein
MTDADEADPLQDAQALLEGAAAHLKEDTYVKICDALRRVYDAREDAKVFEVVVTRTVAKTVLDCDGDPDVSMHMWTHYAKLACTPLLADDVTLRSASELLFMGKYRSHWLGRTTPFVLQDDHETVTVVRVHSAKRKRGE